MGNYVSEKELLLPQLNYDHKPQKVCNECLPVSQLVAKSRSPQFSKKEEAAKLLNEMCKDINQLQKLVELGGMQTLIFLSQSINNSIKENVAEALHMMATHTVLHPLLVQSGAIKALCSLLSDSESLERILIDALSAMMIFCKYENYRKQVVEGALKPILTLCGMKETIALLATTTLSLLVDNEDNLYTVVDKEKEALSKIMNLVNAKDEKMQEIALKILASLSLGTEWHRHRIVQEHYSNGKCLVNVFCTVPSNQQVLVNGICLLGNLATSEKDQSVLRECLECVCALMRKNEVNADVQVQISRCIANFSKHKVNAATLLEYIPEIVRLHVQVEDASTRLYGVKTLFNLLNIEQGHVLSLLTKPQLDSLLHSLLHCTGMHDSLLTCLEKAAPSKSRPMTL